MSKLLEQINKAPRETKKLGDVFEIIDGDRGANYPSKSEFAKTGYCLFLNTKNVPSQGFDFSNVDFISKERDELLRKGKLTRGDMVMTTRGTIGNVAIYTEDLPFDCVRINSGMVILRAKSVYDRTYLYTLMKSDTFNVKLKNTSSGSAQPQLPIRDLREIEIEVPDPPIQKKIARILSAYDAKIENNNNIIKNLEAAAQTIFNEWFVKFRFPGYEKIKFVESETGMIPEGWEIKKISEFCETFGGGTPDTKNLNYWKLGDIYWATPTDMTALNSIFINRTNKSITKEGLKNSSAILLPENTILMTSRATVGILAISKMPITTNQGFIACVCNTQEKSNFLFWWLNSNIKMIKDLAGGSTFPEISRGVFRNIELLVPSQKILLKFSDAISIFHNEIYLLQKENSALKKSRDQLLDKLI